MSRVRTRSARARLALAACALWLTGVEGMPALHEAMHGQLAPHRHDNGSIVTVSFEDTTHRHPDGSIHFVTPRSHATGKALQDGRAHATNTTDTHHADGLAHHAAALAPAPPPVTQPLPIDRRPTAIVIARSVELITRDPLAATARGPPTTA
jgi:hypothetical protein